MSQKVLLNEGAEDDISFNKTARDIYKKICNNINKIKFISTDDSDFVEDSRGKIHLLHGVKFNVNQIDKNYDVDVLLVNNIGIHYSPFYDGDKNTLVFFIISQVNDKTDFENNLEIAKLRFKGWVDERVFMHEFIHFLDKNRYKETYQFKNPEDNNAYFNSPQEYNAYYQEIVNGVTKNSDKLKELNFKDFLKQSLKHGRKDFLKSLNVDNKKKLKNRLYKLYSHLNNEKH